MRHDRYSWALAHNFLDFVLKTHKMFAKNLSKHKLYKDFIVFHQTSLTVLINTRLKAKFLSKNTTFRRENATL